MWCCFRWPFKSSVVCQWQSQYLDFSRVSEEWPPLLSDAAQNLGEKLLPITNFDPSCFSAHSAVARLLPAQSATPAVGSFPFTQLPRRKPAPQPTRLRFLISKLLIGAIGAGCLNIPLLGALLARVAFLVFWYFQSSLRTTSMLGIRLGCCIREALRLF